jgi:murein tripeptide amidase MpaA
MVNMLITGIHAREWISPSTATWIMSQLVERYKANQDLVDFYDIYILPVANPDGLVLNQFFPSFVVNVRRP